MRGSGKKDPGKLVVHILLVIYGLILSYTIGGLIFNYNPPADLFFGLSFALVFFAIGQSLYEIGAMRTVIFFLVTSTIGFGVEVLGANTGFLFGRYSYGDYLGEKVFGVPIVVPLVWFVIVFTVFSLSLHSLVRIITIKASKVLSIIVLAAFGTVAWDLLIDPLFSSYRYWTWKIQPSTPQLSGVPLTNFVGWFVVSFGMLSFIILIFSRLHQSAGRTITRINTIDSRIVYLLLMVDGTVANAVLGHALVVTSGLIAMSMFLLASILLFSIKQ